MVNCGYYPQNALEYKVLCRSPISSVIKLWKSRVRKLRLFTNKHTNKNLNCSRAFLLGSSGRNLKSSARMMNWEKPLSEVIGNNNQQVRFQLLESVRVPFTARCFRLRSMLWGPWKHVSRKDDGWSGPHVQCQTVNPSKQCHKNTQPLCRHGIKREASVNNRVG